MALRRQSLMPTLIDEFLLILAGKPLARIKVCDDTRVVYLTDGSETEPHGYFLSWPGQPEYMTLCYSPKTRPSFKQYIVQNYHSITNRVYLNPAGGALIGADQMTALLTRDAFRMHGRALPLTTDPDGQNIKHVFLWLHPGRGVQLVYINTDLKCIWRSINHDAGIMDDRCGEPNGLFSYNPATNKLYFIFHWRADDDKAQGVQFRCIEEHSRWYRAEGDGARELDPSDLGALASYHILVYQFQ